MEIMLSKEEDELIHLTEQERVFLYQLFFTNNKIEKKYTLGEYCKDLFTRITKSKYIF